MVSKINKCGFQDKCPNARGSISKLVDSRTPQNINNLKTIQCNKWDSPSTHQGIYTHERHHLSKINQETKTSTHITSNRKTSHQRSTKSKELNNGLKWDPDTTQGHLTKSMGNQDFCHCSKDSKGFKLGLEQGQNGSSEIDNHKLNTNAQGIHKGKQGLNSWNQWTDTIETNDNLINNIPLCHR